MIIVAGSVSIKPEHLDEAIQIAQNLSKETRNEAGCISYHFSTSLDDPNTLLIFEQWESAEALEQHFQTDHMKKLQEELPKFVAGPLSIQRYMAESISD